MPGFSRFYSATEKEAAVCLLRFAPRQSEDASHFSNSNAEQLTQLLNGTTVSSPRPRNEFNQPPFRPKPQVQSVEQLLNASTFSIAHRTVYRDKTVCCESNSDDSHEWQTRSRTPSSDEPSPQKYCLPSPNPSVKASSVSGGSEEGVAHAIKPARQKHTRDWTSYADYNATYPQGVLQIMDTQFSKWSYDLNEGTTAIPFVMTRAPTDTHERLVEIDRKLWVTGVEKSASEGVESQATTKALLEHVEQKGPSGIRTDRIKIATSRGIPSQAGLPPKDDSTSKRAAFIAKSKASKDGSLIASKSVGQRRSAMHKNKNRRSIMPSPPLTVRKPEQAQNPDSRAKDTQSTILMINPKDDQQRRAVDSALQNQSIDFEDSRTLESLMKQLGKPKAGAGKDRPVEEVPGPDGNGDVAEQTSRLKGKARKKTKSNAA